MLRVISKQVDDQISWHVHVYTCIILYMYVKDGFAIQTIYMYNICMCVLSKNLIHSFRFEGGVMEHSLRLSEGFAAVLELCDLMSTTREPW